MKTPFRLGLVLLGILTLGGARLGAQVATNAPRFLADAAAPC